MVNKKDNVSKLAMKIEEDKWRSLNGLIRMLWGAKRKSRRSWRPQLQMVMIVFTFVGCNESFWIIIRSLHAFPCSTIHARAPVITSRIRIPSNRFLSVLSPLESIFETVWFPWALRYSSFTWLRLVLHAIINKLKCLTVDAETGVWKQSKTLIIFFYLVLLLLGSSSSLSSHWLLLQPESEVPPVEFAVLGTANSNGVITHPSFIFSWLLQRGLGSSPIDPSDGVWNPEEDEDEARRRRGQEGLEWLCSPWYTISETWPPIDDLSTLFLTGHLGCVHL